MARDNAAPRRVRVERNVYRRADGKLEVGYRDSTGKQRWKAIEGGITAARAERDSILGARGKGERVVPSPRLRFGDAADRWLAEQVAELRENTRASYGNAIETHLRPRWGGRRLDHITTDDCARLVRELRAQGLSEWTISGVLKAASRVFKFARRRMGWHGVTPVDGLENGERPRTAQAGRRRIYRGDELAQTLAAAHEPWRTLLALAAVTGGRESELLGLTWGDVDLGDASAASVTFDHQLSRRGERVELKTEESKRTVELPRSVALMLLEHRARSPRKGDSAFVFATRSGRAISQRNTIRELRRTQERARDADGRPTFPDLFERDGHGEPRVDGRGGYVLRPGSQVPRGAVPSFHGFRHTAASEAIAAGDGAEEVSWQLGHKSSVVTRAVYVQEIKDAERTARRRARMEARYRATLEALVEAPDRRPARRTAGAGHGNVAPLRRIAAD